MMNPLRSDVRADLQGQAAAVLAWFVGGLGALVAAVSLVEMALARAEPLTQTRLRFGFMLVLVALLCAQVLRRGRPRLAAAGLLLAAMLALSIYSWNSGLGVHTMALSGVAVLIAMAGAVAGMRVATGLALLYAAVVAVQAWAEAQGLLPGLAAAPAVLLRNRIIGHLLLALGGWLAARLLYRMVGGALGHAVSESRRLAELLRIGSDWTWEADGQLRITALSDTFEASSGHSRAEFLRLGWPGGPQPLDDADWRTLRGDLRARRTFHDRAVTLRGADGALLGLRITGEPVRDAEGRVLGWRGTSRNVTAERLAQQAQRRTQAMLDRLVDMSPDAICVARLDDGRILLANASFAQTAGRPEPEVLGLSAHELGLWPDATEAVRLREALQRGGGIARDLPTAVHLPDGSVRDMLMTAAAFEWDGEAVAVITVRDVTERLRQERELAQAKRQAESANAAKSAFLATMSHEIRTPLGGVLGMARMLQDPALDEARRREYLGHLMNSADQLSGIVSDVLDLSKIEAGQLQLEAIDFDLRALATGSFETYAALGRERGLAVALTLDPALPARVRGDPVRVRQILANFLSNALKFTERGSVALRLSAATEARVRIEVQDSGVGVPGALRERLFEPFVQADSSTTRRYGGSGLGLSICRELAQRMDGAVGVDSDGRSGSCFWAELRLPAAALPAPAPAAPDHAAAAPLAGLRLLVAEDNPVNRLIACTLLQRLGAEVLEAEDGAQAVAIAQREAAALHAVLMDLHMPVVDGLAATRALQGDPRTAALPVLAFSAAVLAHERAEAAAAGMAGFIAKPVEEAELLRLLAPLAAASR